MLKLPKTSIITTKWQKQSCYLHWFEMEARYYSGNIAKGTIQLSWSDAFIPVLSLTLKEKKIPLMGLFSIRTWKSYNLIITTIVSHISFLLSFVETRRNGHIWNWMGRDGTSAEAIFLVISKPGEKIPNALKLKVKIRFLHNKLLN